MTKGRGRQAANGAASVNGIPEHRYEQVAIDRCRMLRRNPQYLTPKTMRALEQSIRRDGFVVPILVRPMGDGDELEVVSGNHRFMAAQRMGLASVPAVIANLGDADMQRLALNLNLIHGDPLAEQLAPFLADMSDDALAGVFIPDQLLQAILAFDEELRETLAKLAVPKALDTANVLTPIGQCRCPTCGKSHIASTFSGSTNTTDSSVSSMPGDTQRSSVAARSASVRKTAERSRSPRKTGTPRSPS